MDSRYLRAFVSVADLGGISAAAERLGYAQSTVSAQLRRLESELGLSVLSRTNAGAELTEAGRRLLPFAREALDLDARMRSAVTGGRPHVRVGALESLAAEWLPDIAIALEHGAGGPGVHAEISLTVGNRERLGGELSAGRLDLIFLFDNGEVAKGPHAKVAEDDVVLVAAPDHPLARARVVTLDMLAGMEFLIAEPGCTTDMLLDRLGRDVLRQSPIGMITGSLGALVHLAANGRGVALLPFLAAARHIESGDLVRLDVPGALTRVHIEARWRARLGPADTAVQALVRLARGHTLPRPAELDAGAAAS